MITHGGLGTIAAALSHGVPLVCQPVCRDQPLNARRVGDLGAGVTVEDGAAPESIAAAADTILALAGRRR